ncbi:hypothetical protein LguiA_011551 [Lonicera macranthoides]
MSIIPSFLLYEIDLFLPFTIILLNKLDINVLWTTAVMSHLKYNHPTKKKKNSHTS